MDKKENNRLKNVVKKLKTTNKQKCCNIFFVFPKIGLVSPLDQQLNWFHLNSKFKVQWEYAKASYCWHLRAQSKKNIFCITTSFYYKLFFIV